MGKKSFIYFKDFTDLDFLFSFFSFSFFFLSISLIDKLLFTLSVRKEYAVLWAANRFVGLETPKHNDFDQSWKFKFHFEYFPRNTRFLSFGGASNYLYLFKNHRQTFSWPGVRPSSHFEVTKMWFGPNTKYLLEPWFPDIWCLEGISCLHLFRQTTYSKLKL